jgi:hypothetical protein
MRFKSRRKGQFRSGLEQAVAENLTDRGIPFAYEVGKLNYVVHRVYTPDFTIGDLHFEVKGWWPADERAKLLSVIRCNPTLKIIVALENPHLTITRKSKTTYAAWCKKHGIPWCRIPISEEILSSWQEGTPVTFLAPETDAIAPMVPPSTQTDLFTALSAADDSTVTDHSGNM